MKDAEEKLTELQNKHDQMKQSYSTLESEYTARKKELEALQANLKNRSLEITNNDTKNAFKEWDLWAGPINQTLLNISAGVYEPGDYR